MLEQSNADSPATAAISERRQSPRLTLAKLVYIHLEPESGAIVLNVSEGGLGFHAVAPVTQTGAIRFWVSLNMNQRVEASGQLAWTDESRKTGGLRFTALSEGARQQIRKWMNQPSASGFRRETARTSGSACNCHRSIPRPQHRGHSRVGNARLAARIARPRASRTSFAVFPAAWTNRSLAP